MLEGVAQLPTGTGVKRRGGSILMVTVTVISTVREPSALFVLRVLLLSKFGALGQLVVYTMKLYALW